MLETFAAIGKPEDAADEVIKRFGDYCKTVSFGIPTPNSDEELRAQRIIARLAPNASSPASTNPAPSRPNEQLPNFAPKSSNPSASEAAPVQAAGAPEISTGGGVGRKARQGWMNVTPSLLDS